jgi:hypothetical protein
LALASPIERRAGGAAGSLVFLSEASSASRAVPALAPPAVDVFD